MYLIHKAQDMDKWQAPVNTHNEPFGSQEVQEFLSNQGSLSFSQMAKLNGDNVPSGGLQ